MTCIFSKSEDIINEIDINIEGYNVNGICVGCLNYNRKMFYADEVKECFRILANIDVPDGLNIQVCWECMAAIRRVKTFQTQITTSYTILTEYSRKHMFLDSPSDLSQHAISRLTTEVLSNTSDYLGTQVDNYEVLTLEEVKVEFEDIESFPDEETKPAVFDQGIDNEYSIEPDQLLDIAAVQDNTVSSDEEVQLSQLKRNKERRAKKAKVKTKFRKRQATPTKPSYTLRRKLKNIPEDQVELITLSEEDMWLVRKDDAASEAFVSSKFKCCDCLRTFTTGKLMRGHLKSKHRPKTPASVQCDVCLCYYTSKDNLTSHRPHHYDAFKCRQCSFRTGLKLTMMRHLREHTAPNDRKEGNECDKCGVAFETKSKLSYHRAVCKSTKPQCDCCGKVFANKVTLKNHLNMRAAPVGVKGEKQKEVKEKVAIECKGCQKVFPSRKSYRAHVVIHDGLEYPCPVCGKLFQWKRNLARHLRNHADREAGQRHECRQCGKRFSSRDSYNNHMRFSKQHVTEDMFVHGCEYCGKKFATKWCLVDHVDWEHLKKIKYQCGICLKAFKTAKILVAHKNNIHEGKKKLEPDRKHLCDICGKSYKTDKRLKGHVWAMHTHRSTTKSFKCKMCPATFTWQTSIYKHVKMMHCNKKGAKQQTRVQQVQPKPDPYSEVELDRSRMYYQQTLLHTNQGLVQGIGQNMA